MLFSLIAYLWIGYKLFGNTTKRFRLLRRVITNHVDDFPEQYRESLKLKFWQMKMFGMVLALYLTLTIAHEMVKICFVSTGTDIGQFNDEIKTIAVEFGYMLIFLALMWVFRPRKDWPEFYGIGLETINNLIVIEGAIRGGPNDQRRIPMCPILTFKIENKDVFDADFDPMTAQMLETNRNSGYEDDCMAQRDSRLSLMSKQLLGLAEEEFDPNRLT